MVHSVRMAYPEDLQEVLRDTLREATPEEDFLTDKVYRYCQETGDFMVYKGTVFLQVGGPTKRTRRRQSKASITWESF